MIIISTPNSDSLPNSEKLPYELFIGIDKSEDEFYEIIKPTLDQIKKEPSDEVVQKILNFSIYFDSYSSFDVILQTACEPVALFRYYPSRKVNYSF